MTMDKIAQLIFEQYYNRKPNIASKTDVIELKNIMANTEIKTQVVSTNNCRIVRACTDMACNYVRSKRNQSPRQWKQTE